MRKLSAFSEHFVKELLQIWLSVAGGGGDDDDDEDDDDSEEAPGPGGIVGDVLGK